MIILEYQHQQPRLAQTLPKPPFGPRMSPSMSDLEHSDNIPNKLHHYKMAIPLDLLQGNSSGDQAVEEVIKYLEKTHTEQMLQVYQSP